MIKQPDILFCIEHVARELNIACAIRSIVERQSGLSVHIHVLSSRLDSDIASPRLITVPYCGSRRFVPRDILERFPKSPVLSLTCEQLLSRENRRYRLPKDDFARQQVIYGAAGDFYRNWLINAKVDRSNIDVVGSLPFQLYREPYRRMFESHRNALAMQHGLNPNLPWVLFPENFGAAFFSISQARKRILGGYRPRHLLAYIKYAKKSFAEIARWCSSAGATSSDFELIVRPRPAMSYDIFTRQFREAANIDQSTRLRFIKEGPIQEWILASQLVISSYSTTLLEAAAAGTPAFLLAPYAIPESASSEWHRNAPFIRSNDQFQALLSDPNAATLAPSLSEWAEANLLGRGDAIQNVARLISDICLGARETPRRTNAPWWHRCTQQIRDGLSKPERFLRTRLRPGRRRIFGHECDDIRRQEIDTCTDHWSDLLAQQRDRAAA